MKYYPLPLVVKQIASCQSRPSNQLSISQKVKAVLAELPKDSQVKMVQENFKANYELLLNIKSFS